MNIKTVLVILASGFAIAYVAMSIRFTQAPVHSISRQFSTDTLYHQARAKLAKLNQDASAAWRKKNLPEAERLFRQALALDTSDDDAWISLARMMDEQGRYREALTFYDGLLGPHTWGSSLEHERAILTRYADLCDMFGRPDDATKACLKVLHLNPDPRKNCLDDPYMFVRVDTDDPTEIRARAHILTGMWLQGYSVGYAYRRAETITSAVRAFKEAVRLKPELPIAHYYLAQGLRHIGHKAEAQAEFARAEDLGDETFRAAMHAKATKKAEDDKRYWDPSNQRSVMVPLKISPEQIAHYHEKGRLDKEAAVRWLAAAAAKKAKAQGQP